MGMTSSTQQWLSSKNSIIQQCASQKQLHQKLIFIQHQDFNNPSLALQSIQIFRLSLAPYQSIMKTSRVLISITRIILQTFLLQSPLYEFYFQLFKRLLTQISHKNLAMLHFTKIIYENNKCLRTIKIQNYSTYYKIELRDVIEARKKEDNRFKLEEIMYVMYSLVEFGKCMKDNGIAYGHYSSKNIYISDKGYLKLYLFHVQPQNNHLNYFHLLSQPITSLSKQLPFAPQFIPQLFSNNLKPQFNYYKSDIFNIGMVLIQMMMENTLQRYYRVNKGGVVIEECKLLKDLNQLKEVYDRRAIEIVEKMVKVKVEERWGFEEVMDQLNNIKNQGRMYQNCAEIQVKFACQLDLVSIHSNNINSPQQHYIDNNNQKLSYKSIQKQSQSTFVLKSIQNSLESKLHPQPLKSLLMVNNNNNIKSRNIPFNSSNQKINMSKKQNYLNSKKTSMSISLSLSVSNYNENGHGSNNSVSINSKNNYMRRRNTGVSVQSISMGKRSKYYKEDQVNYNSNSLNSNTNMTSKHNTQNNNSNNNRNNTHSNNNTNKNHNYDYKSYQSSKLPTVRRHVQLNNIDHVNNDRSVMFSSSHNNNYTTSQTNQTIQSKLLYDESIYQQKYVSFLNYQNRNNQNKRMNDLDGVGHVGTQAKENVQKNIIISTHLKGYNKKCRKDQENIINRKNKQNLINIHKNSNITNTNNQDFMKFQCQHQQKQLISHINNIDIDNGQVIQKQPTTVRPKIKMNHHFRA